MNILNNRSKLKGNKDFYYFLSLLLQLVPFPVHIFKADYHYLERYDGGEDDSWNVLKTDYPFRRQLIDKVRKDKILLFTGERPVLFGGVLCQNNEVLIVGPITITPVDANFRLLYAQKHNAKNVSLFYGKPNTLASFLLLCHSILTNRRISLTSFLDKYFLSEKMLGFVEEQKAKIYFKNFEGERHHNPAIFEEEIVNSIVEGNIVKLRKALESPYANMRGVLSYKSDLRAEQNLAIIDITIATRAAIRAGLSVEAMYVLADSFIIEVEDCKEVGDASALARSCELRCAQIVKQFKAEKYGDEEKSAVVISTCNFITAHVYERLDVELIANQLNISQGYLSRIFKREMGMTITEYAHKAKVQVAKDLLIYTNKTVSEIATILSFSSQSHFGQVFLAISGTSPAKYRTKHSIRDY